MEEIIQSEQLSFALESNHPREKGDKRSFFSHIIDLSVNRISKYMLIDCPAIKNIS